MCEHLPPLPTCLASLVTRVELFELNCFSGKKVSVSTLLLWGIWMHCYFLNFCGMSHSSTAQAQSATALWVANTPLPDRAGDFTPFIRPTTLSRKSVTSTCKLTGLWDFLYDRRCCELIWMVSCLSVVPKVSRSGRQVAVRSSTSAILGCFRTKEAFSELVL
jgi:hypothetical protein